MASFPEDSEYSRSTRVGCHLTWSNCGLELDTGSMKPLVFASVAPGAPYYELQGPPPMPLLPATLRARSGPTNLALSMLWQAASAARVGTAAAAPSRLPTSAGSAWAHHDGPGLPVLPVARARRTLTLMVTVALRLRRLLGPGPARAAGQPRWLTRRNEPDLAEWPRPGPRGPRAGRYEPVWTTPMRGGVARCQCPRSRTNNVGFLQLL